MTKLTTQKKNEILGIWNLGFGVSAQRRGFTLFYSVLVSSLLLAIGMAIFNITFKELVLSSGSRESTNAFYAADSGIECAFYWDLDYSGISAPAFGFYGDSLASGLSGYWRFEDDTGATVARDSGGQGKDGTLTNMDALTAWVNGQIGGALQFDGSNDYIAVSDVTDPTAYTITMWVRPSLVRSQNIFTRTDVNGPTVSWSHQVAMFTGNVFWHYLWDGSPRAVVGTTVPQPNTWYHVAATAQNGGQMRLYVNGVSEGTPATIGTMWTGGDRYRIAAASAGISAFAGTVDDLRLYNRVLSGTEIQRLYQQTSNIVFTNPVAEGSGAMCLGADITDPDTGWDTTSGWVIETGTNRATTTFDVELLDGRCATVTVAKDADNTTVISRGYNTCNLEDPRRVERAIKATY